MVNATSYVMRGVLPSEMWKGLPYTYFIVDGKAWCVTGACSGKMLLVYLLVTAFYRLFVSRSRGWWKLAVASFPLAVVFNALRCFVVMKYSYDQLSHDLLGFAVYALIVVPCMFIPLDGGTEGEEK